MSRLSTIELYKEDMKFSAGHFTIFSPTVRENLHGHNYQVSAALTTEIGQEGLSFDYRLYRDKLMHICQQLDETVLLPTRSLHLKIEDAGDYYHLFFHTEKMIFLKRDVTLIDVTNITLEELSNWFIQQLLKEPDELEHHKIQKIKIKIASAPGQSGSSKWKRP